MKTELEVNYNVFRNVNYDLTEEECLFCYKNINNNSISKIYFFKCLNWLRSKEIFPIITDNQYYYTIQLKDYENDFEPYPKFNNICVIQALFYACEYVNNLKKD